MIKPDAVACSLHGTDHYLNRKSRISDHSSKNAPPYDLRHQQILCGTQSASIFFRNLSLFMTSGPVVVMVLEKENAIAEFRTLIGNTDPQAAPTGSIRKIFGQSKTRNAIHGSDSDENALREIHFFFSEREIVPEPYRLPIPEAEIDS